MVAALRAGVVYFAIVFAIGFALGAIRVLLVSPSVGEIGAVAIEIPVMLLLSWVACTWLVRRFAVPPETVERLVMGSLAFGLLMVGELAVSVFGFGRTASQHFASYRAFGAQIGLAAQILFALIPFAQTISRR